MVLAAIMITSIQFALRNQGKVGEPKLKTERLQTENYKAQRDIIRANIDPYFLFNSLYTLRRERHPVFKKLEYLEDVCDPQQFFRVNRQMLVSRKAVRGFASYFNRRVVLSLSIKLKEQVIVSWLKVTPL